MFPIFKWRQLRYTLYECSWIEWNKKNRNALRLNLIYLTRELALYEFCNKAMDLDLIIQVTITFYSEYMKFVDLLFLLIYSLSESVPSYYNEPKSTSAC